LDETAQKMGLTVAAAKSRVLRAKAALRKSPALRSIQDLSMRAEVRSSSAA
jgi:DNA-directed RNA polymerase specialized sigma24 family protein